MITQINKAFGYSVAFKASGQLTQEDFQTVVFPAVNELVSRTGKLNFLLYLDATIENFTIGAWLGDPNYEVRNLANWNRAAIVTDSSNTIRFTNGFSYIMPGEFRGFEKEELSEALQWVNTY